MMKRQLPVLPMLIAAIDLCREHAAYAVKIIGPWFLVLAIGPCVLAGMSGEESLQAADGESLGETFFFLLTIVAWGSIAVLWHWRILRDDSLSQRAVIFEMRMWLYALKFVLISIIVTGSSFLLILSMSSTAASYVTSVFGGIGFFTMFFGAILSALLVGARLSIALPAVALNVPDFGFGKAWKATDGNGIRLLVISALPFLPILLLTVQIEQNGEPVLDFSQWSAPFALKHILHETVEFSFGLLSLTVLSLAYAFFVESKEAGGIRTSP